LRPFIHPVSLPQENHHGRLYQYIFRGEPAISGLVWHITPNLKSSHVIAATTSSGLPPIFIGVHPAQD